MHSQVSLSLQLRCCRLALGRDASSVSWCGFLAHSSGRLRVQLLSLPDAAKFFFSGISKTWMLIDLNSPEPPD